MMRQNATVNIRTKSTARYRFQKKEEKKETVNVAQSH